MARKRRPLPTEPQIARIDSVDRRGRGVCIVNGRSVYLPGTLAGELVEFKYVRRARRSDDGQVSAVLEPAAHRVTPGCEHFSICGGCRSQHVEHGHQIKACQDELIDLLVEADVKPDAIVAPLTGPIWGYRRRARLAARLVPKKGGVLVGFREKGTNYVAEMDSCEVLDPMVGHRIKDLKALLSDLSIPAAIPQIEVAMGDDAAALVFRHVEPFNTDDLMKLEKFGAASGLRIFLQSGGLHTVRPLSTDTPPELTYRLDAFDVTMTFTPIDFVQINARINAALVARAVEWLQPEPGERVLDLFCGLGNFTLPLARSGAMLRGVEGDAGLIERARRNAEANFDADGVGRIEFTVEDLFDDSAVASALNWRPDKLLLDPPRSGARSVAMDLAARPEVRPSRIVYVSCNPTTFAEDAGYLQSAGYRLTKVGVVDMFPHTGHVETIGQFDTRSDGDE